MMVNKAVNVLNYFLQNVEGGRRHTGIWFNCQSLKNKKKTYVIKFIPAKMKDESKMSDQMSQYMKLRPMLSLGDVSFVEEVDTQNKFSTCFMDI